MEEEIIHNINSDIIQQDSSSKNILSQDAHEKSNLSSSKSSSYS